MTLQDEITETDETLIATIAPSPAPTANGDRIRARLDAAAGLLTVHMNDGDGGGLATYSLASIPDTMRAHLALVGLQTILLRAKNPLVAMARMQSGHLPGKRPGKAPEMNPWRLAYAHAKVEATRKSDEPMSLEEAKAAAAALPTGKLREAKAHPLVVKHYARITNAPAELV